jgi:hypothetical protein
MRKLPLILASLLIANFVSISVAQQKAVPPYKLTAMKIVPFEGTSGKFEDEIRTAGEEREYLNELSKSLFVTIEVSGKKDTENYPGRQLEVTVMEGKKLKTKRTELIGILNDEGKFYVPVFLYSAMCDEVTIKARIIGQKTPATISRKLSFQCGE